MSFNWPSLLAVAFGGAGGALARWGVTLLGRSWGFPPAATVVVNVAGCFALGVLTSTAAAGSAPSPLRAGLAVGFLGAFTTFSTYAVEVVQAGNHPRQVIVLLMLHNGLGLLAAAAGLWLGAVIRPSITGSAPT